MKDIEYLATYTVSAIKYTGFSKSILAIEELLGESVSIDPDINCLISNFRGICIPPLSYLVKDTISGEFSVLTEEEFNKRFKRYKNEN